MTTSHEEACRRISAATRAGSSSLDLSGLGLTELPEQIAGLHTAQEINLDGNLLTSLPDWLDGMRSITNLSVDENRLLELPEWLGEHTQLTALSVNHNLLIDLPDWMGELTAPPPHREVPAKPLTTKTEPADVTQASHDAF